ncbi:hypothetical protein NF681_06980 [Comamonadaceae bacterium OTU4NAUVB1]|nr:hypothetical protein NF681_06980 [Comamonadaceae bacterium OTU4NAUVB1]
MSALIQQAKTVRATVLFVLVAPDVYRLGLDGNTAIYAPRSNARKTASMLHALAESRGQWVNASGLLEGAERTRPDKCVRQALLRGVDQIGNVSTKLAAALSTIETEMRGDEVWVRVLDRETGFFIETVPMPFHLHS